MASKVSYINNNVKKIIMGSPFSFKIGEKGIKKLTAKHFQAALAYDPNIITKEVGTSPLATLFKNIIPKLEPMLVGFGKKKADAIIGKIIDHSKEVIRNNSEQEAMGILRDFYRDLPTYGQILKGDNGIEKVSNAYKGLAKGNGFEYLKIKLDGYYDALTIDELGNISLGLLNNMNNKNLIYKWMYTLKNVKNLINLDLQKTEISNTGLEQIAGLKNLQGLALPTPKREWRSDDPQDDSDPIEISCITDAGLEPLKTMPNLRRINLHGAEISGAGMEHLRGIIRLQELDLSDNYIRDENFKYIRGLGNLQKLNLSGTGITDAKLEHIKGLINLQTLDLSNTKISDAGLKHINGLINLKKLYLFNTKITIAGLKYIEGLINPQIFI
jgi:uncharacterized protein YjbI with pentapeptide repeats